MEILVINGPNLNLLGTREIGIYGKSTYKQIEKELLKEAEQLEVHLTIKQSNHEGDLIDWIQGAKENGFSGILINPAALTHYSISLVDAIRSIDLPVVEVHLSNLTQREEYRRVSLTASACRGSIMGFGPASYMLGLRGLLHIIEKEG